jgi:ABC-type branched-subunit amino acid transport system permease subunit
MDQPSKAQALVGGGVMSSLVITLILFIAVLGLDVLMGYAGQNPRRHRLGRFTP